MIFRSYFSRPDRLRCWRIVVKTEEASLSEFVVAVVAATTATSIPMIYYRCCWMEEMKKKEFLFSSRADNAPWFSADSAVAAHPSITII